jgi:hypothetical protein
MSIVDHFLQEKKTPKKMTLHMTVSVRRKKIPKKRGV